MAFSFTQRFTRPATQPAALIDQIDACQLAVQRLSSEQLRSQSLELRFRAKSGEPRETLLVDAFALVREAATRTIGLSHFNVQLLGGIEIQRGAIAEMETGEGKTLVATLPLVLFALQGLGAHLATANDYLAARDAEIMQPVYEALGLTVGVVEAQCQPQQRREAYHCDITYGTAKEFGFDFLRDRLLKRRLREQDNSLDRMLGLAGTAEQPVQRKLHFALVDEADSLLIDEARTPLVISAIPDSGPNVKIESFNWAASVAASSQFVDGKHTFYDAEKKSVYLTAAGRRLVRSLPKPDTVRILPVSHLYQYIERAVLVNRDFVRDRQYVVRENEIVIVAEQTGRLAEGQKWRGGIHQAIEAKEGIEVTVSAGHAAQITVQDYFSSYSHLGGMTGTATGSEREFKNVYQLNVIRIPTHRPNKRIRLPDRILGTADEKWRAIVDDVRELRAAGRPVLIGTQSIEKSERLSALLETAGIEHSVLNAKQLAREAEIVTEAGQAGRVTVATNMAGRGTDIKLASGVAESGGLHVICSELHESERIDRQLVGRCARQGDPGTWRQYMSLDDDVLKVAFGTAKSARLKTRGETHSKSRFDQLKSTFTQAQQLVAKRHFDQRQQMMDFNKNRRKLHLQMGTDPYLDSPDSSE